jgi:hypothetical protein
MVGKGNGIGRKRGVGNERWDWREDGGEVRLI